MTSSLLVGRHANRRSDAAPRHHHHTPIQRLEPFLLISPTMLVILGLMVVPIVIVIGYSLMDNVVTNPHPKFVGLANYTAILGDPAFWGAAVNTLVFTVGSVVVHMLIGMVFAMMLNSETMARVPRAIFRAIYILPWIFTASVVAVLWRLLLDPSGVINYVLISLGILHEAVPWLCDAVHGPARGDRHQHLVRLPVLHDQPAGRAAGHPDRSLRGRPCRWGGLLPPFANMTLPALKPILYSMALLDLLWTTQQFTLDLGDDRRRPLGVTEVLSTFTYKLAFNAYQFSMAATSAVLVLGASLIVAVFYVRNQRREA